MPERFGELRALVEAALEQPPDEREGFIRTRCADPALETEALALVAACAREDELLQAPPPRMAFGSAGTLPEGAQVGPFRIERVLGEGGMGTVYEAVQEQPRRRVALKVLRQGRSSDAARRRFEYEVEVLGALRHPGIAQIHAAGVSEAQGEGHPELRWFAMEFVPDAAPLLRYADAHQLGTNARLQLFLDVCDAVESGHQRGVIHRDLKPDNLLVDGDGRVKVIDFGVARVADTESIEATLRTQADEIVGTLPYMSPEQVAGQRCDTRTDVYGLGVVLYQLLTGALPIEVERSDIVTSARRILEDTPRRPGLASPGMAADIEAILLRALEKDPERRYGSADALAADIRRHLEGRPVEARPPNALYHMRLFARRNKVLVLGITAVLLVSIAATVISVGFALRSKEAEVDARSQAREAERQRSRFETLYETQFGQSMASVETHARELMQLVGGPPVARRIVSDAIQRLEALEGISGGDPAVRRGLVEAYIALGAALASYGNTDRGVDDSMLDSFEQALHVVDSLEADESASDAIDGLRARVLGVLAAQASVIPGAEARADAWIQQAGMILQERTLPASVEASIHLARGRRASQRKTFAQAIEHFTEEVRCRKDAVTRAEGKDAERLLAAAYQRRGIAHVNARAWPGASADFEAQLGILVPLQEARPDDIQLAVLTIGAWVDRGMSLSAVRPGPEMTQAYEAGEALLATYEPRAPQHHLLLWAKARLLWSRGQRAMSTTMRKHPKGSAARTDGMRTAIAHWREGLAIYERLEEHGRSDRELTKARSNLENAIAMMERMLGGNGGDHPR